MKTIIRNKEFKHSMHDHSSEPMAGVLSLTQNKRRDRIVLIHRTVPDDEGKCVDESGEYILSISLEQELWSQ